MLEWINNTFPNGEFDKVIFDSDSQTIEQSPSILADNLSAFNAPPTYEELKASDMDGNGWGRIFDYWKEQGYVI